MNTPRSASPPGAYRRGVYAGSILISLAVVALLVAAFLPRLYAYSFSRLLLTLVLMALATSIALHARFLILARRQHRETANALTTTEHEFQAIFDSALDGQLILDEQGTCLEANPAALAILGSGREELIGHPVRGFKRGPRSFENTEPGILGWTDGQGETQIVRQDGQPIFVDYTAKANYVPGRHFIALRDISGRKQAEIALRESDDRFHQMADNIVETFWMLDAQTSQVLYVNRAFEAVTGRSCDALRADPTSFQELLHPEDQHRVLARLREATRTGQVDEEFRIVRPDHAIRWVWVRGFPVRDSAGAVCRLVGTAQDITARKSAEEQMARNLALAQSARAEADALRKTTLALTQNLSMDYVLDTLLESLLELVPCDSAQVLLAETDERFFLARERHSPQDARPTHRSPTTWNAMDHAPLMQVLMTRRGLLVADTAEQQGWRQFRGHSHFHSWLCVPLIASQRVLGLLSLGDSEAQAFTQEHLRVARSLAIPAAVAIQNARLFERAEIYGVELEKRLADLEQAQQALQQAEQNRALSEEKFSKVFRSTAIAFSITTLEEGRFIEVNEAFEHRYGYSRDELIGRTAFDLGIWADPAERSQVLNDLLADGRARNRVTHFRKRSGETLETLYSAHSLELDGRQCILAVSEDIHDRTHLLATPDRRASFTG